MRTIFVAALLLICLQVIGCSNNPAPAPAPRTVETKATPADPNAPKPDSPLPDAAYKAELSLVEPLTTMHPGEKKIINVKVKNASNVLWLVYGTQPDLKYRVAVGNGWLDSKQKLITKMDGRHGLDVNLAPGKEVQVPLQITAPAKPGEYYLQLDMVQELVTWFEDKGSPVFKAKVNVQ
jgi:hypothetical protein